MSVKKIAFLWTDLFHKGKQKERGLTERLAEAALFKGLSERELQYISSFLYRRSFQPTEPIFSEGERGFGMYLILKGKVRIQTLQGAQSIDVAELSEGSFFGELSLLYPMSLRTASAFALNEVEAVGFFKPDLDEIISRKPELGVKIMTQLARVLGKRLIESNNLLEEEGLIPK